MHISELLQLCICPREINIKCIRSERVRRVNRLQELIKGLEGLMEIILPFQCFELWLMIIIDERDWLTTFPKDTHIKFHSQQVGVWETGRACPQMPLACSPCKGNLPRALWFYMWVCSHKPSQSWLPLPPAPRTAFPLIRTLLPSFRRLKPP